MIIKPRSGKTKSLNALINKDTSNLSRIFNRAQLLQQLNTLLNKYLPEDLQDKYRVANFNQGQLIVFTASAAYLTRWRFVQQQVLYHLQQELPQLQSISLKVRPEAPERPTKPQPLQISNRSAQKLAAVAADTENPRLQAALLKLAQLAPDA